MKQKEIFENQWINLEGAGSVFRFIKDNTDTEDTVYGLPALLFIGIANASEHQNNYDEVTFFDLFGLESLLNWFILKHVSYWFSSFWFIWLNI